MNLEIIFENREILVFNKPAGLVVNRSQTVSVETLQDQIADYLGLSENDLGIGERAGIVHRLDRETSGLLLVAKTEKSFERLQEQFKSRKVEKEYVALVHGNIKDEKVEIVNKLIRIGKYGKFGVANNHQEGKDSESLVLKISNLQFSQLKFKNILEKADFNKVRRRYLEKNATHYTLVSVFPKTGRTHQIRVHLKHFGNPVVADTIYAPSKLLSFDSYWCPRLFLHARSIKFIDPLNNKELYFTQEIPSELKLVLKNLESAI